MSIATEFLSTSVIIGTWLPFLVISFFRKLKLQVASIATWLNITSYITIMVSNFVMIKTITSKCAILCLRVDLLLFIRHQIHFNSLWKNTRYKFFLLFQMIKKTCNTSGPLYVQIYSVYLGSWAMRRHEIHKAYLILWLSWMNCHSLQLKREMFQCHNIIP